MMENNGPLSGVRVVDLTSYVAASSCSRILADWGADVIKVEPPSGDVWRYFGPTMSTPANEEENPFWDVVNSSKRGIVLNLRLSGGQKVLHELLKTADVFLTNTRPDALKKMSLDYESLKEKFPGLIYALVTGFGENGPDCDRPGFDVVAFWARSGFLVDLVKPGEYPLYSPAGFGDLSVGSTLVGGICAALFNRQRTGRGDKISISLYGTAIWFSSILITATQERYGNRYPKARIEGNPMAIPYRCKDGEWIIIAILDFEKHWSALYKALGREDLIADKRFNTRASMLNHRKELIAILEETFASKESAEWLELLKEADIVHERMRHFGEVSKDEQAWANHFVYEHKFASGEGAILPNTPLQFFQNESLPCKRGPLLAEHTKEVLVELGYSPVQIEEMIKNKVVVSR
jgi:crotonobetainyl-CoA:carnitine CoA-transferase CaiB-like acyl-CoA transferase